MYKKQLALGLVIALVVVITPASADYKFSGWPLETRANGTVNGGVFIDYIPWDGSNNLTLTTLVPNVTVKWARLYVGTWGGSEDRSGWVNITFNGVADRNGLGPIQLEGQNDMNTNVWCTSRGKYWYWYNVTNLTSPGGINTATHSVINGTLDPGYGGRCYGLVLVVIYEGGPNPPTTDYWINDGHDLLDYSDTQGTTDFSGAVSNFSNVAQANLTMVWLTAEVGSDSAKFNGHILDTSMIVSNKFDIPVWDVTKFVTPSGNGVWYSRGSDEGYVSIPLSILVIEKRDPAEFFGPGPSDHPYPSIAGEHSGTLLVTNNTIVDTICTYSCAGTGGHMEFVRIWNATIGECAEGHWNGFGGDYHNVSLNRTLTLKKGVLYNYSIRTGSYPQIHHQKVLAVDGGSIRCSNFTDVNGREHEDWIPAFKLYHRVI